MIKWGKKIKLFLGILLGLIILGCRFSESVFADQFNHPQTCKVGFYVTSIRNLKFPKKTYNADFWLWSVCPSPDLKPLEQVDIIGAKKYKVTYDFLVERENKTGQFYPHKTLFLSQKRIKATMAQSWKVDNYPFDQHRLKISIVEPNKEINEFVYTPDYVNSGLDPNIKLAGWKVKDFALTSNLEQYSTNFGDPSSKKSEEDFAELTAEFTLKRTGLYSFIKLTSGVYISVAVAFLAFFYDSNNVSLLAPRKSILVGTLFTALANMRVSESVLGRTEGVTLVDGIHILSILYILAIAIMTIISRLLSENGQGKLAMWLDRTVLFWFFVGSYLLINTLAIAYALLVG